MGSPVCERSSSIRLGEALLGAGREVLAWDPDPRTRAHLEAATDLPFAWCETLEAAARAPQAVVAHPLGGLAEAILALWPRGRLVDPWGALGGRGHGAPRSGATFEGAV